MLRVVPEGILVDATGRGRRPHGRSPGEPPAHTRRGPGPGSRGAEHGVRAPRPSPAPPDAAPRHLRCARHGAGQRRAGRGLGVPVRSRGELAAARPARARLQLPARRPPSTCAWTQPVRSPPPTSSTAPMKAPSPASFAATPTNGTPGASRPPSSPGDPSPTTAQLSGAVAAAVPAPARRRSHPARRTFQALRIEVNGELEMLEGALAGAIERLSTSGRCAVLSYHSGEDPDRQGRSSGGLPASSRRHGRVCLPPRAPRPPSGSSRGGPSPRPTRRRPPTTGRVRPGCGPWNV